MTSDGQSIERLREYLRALTPEAQSLLVEELERNPLRDDESGGNTLVLQELRHAIGTDAQPVPLSGDAARLFFAPLEPFLIDARADHKRIGRIARLSLEAIWAWVGRDLMPAEAKALTEDINRALHAGDRSKAELRVRALHECAVQRIKATVDGVGSDDKARRRLAVQVGIPRALDDLNTIFAILSLRDVLADLGRRLPTYIRAFERDQIEPVKALLDHAVAQPAVAAAGARKIYLYGLILVMNRLPAPWQLIRIATSAADSDSTARIVATPYAAAVTIVLSEVENMIGELRAEFKSGRPVAAMLKGIHDAARGLRSEIDLFGNSVWSRQLAAIRADVSDLLNAEIVTTPGFVRRLLRPRPANEIAPGAQLDAINVNEAETRVEFVSACRHYANELAISEVTMRAHSDLALYLETGTKVLLNSLRHAGDDDLPFRQSQVEAAIRFCRIVFGGEYAGLLCKAAEVAVQTAPSERKSARA